MASKIKTGLSESTLGKSSPGSLRVGKVTTRIVAKSDSNSPSTIQQPRISLQRSSSISKPSTEKKSPRVTTPPQKAQTRTVKGSESQPRLIQVKEELRKANEVISLLENEKAKALNELKEAQDKAEEASEKLNEVLEAQKKAQENFEIEKFEAVEAGIEAVQRREEELEYVKNQYALELAAFRKELEKAKQELDDANDAKSKVLSQADDANKMAAIHKEKVEILSSELIRLKAMFDSTREKETISKNEIASKLGLEIEDLKRDLEKARSFEAKVNELEMIIEQLNVDLEAANMAEAYALDSADEWQNKARKLEKQLEEANMLERSVSMSLVSMTKQLEGSNSRVQDMESEVTELKEKIELLEMTVARQKVDLEKSEERLVIEEEEVAKIEKEVEELKNELEAVNDEKEQTLKKEQEATSSVERLLEEKNKILSELESLKEEEEKNKKAMESLASALHEVSSESRELKEELLRRDDQDYETQIKDLKLVIKQTNKKYENMLDEARHEIDVLVNAVEQTKKQFESAMVDWEMREAGLVNHVKEFDEEVSSMGKEMNRLGDLVKRTKDEADAAWEKESEMRESLKEVEDEVVYLQETLREAKDETLKLQKKMLDKETEFQSVVDENNELRVKQDDSVKKIMELTKLLEEALAKKKHTREVSESDKDYDMLEFCEENGYRSAKERSSKLNSIDGLNMKLEEETEEEELNMIEQKEKTSPVSGLIGEDEVLKEKEKKKKKTLFGKVGNLLKKKGPMSQK